MKNDDPEAEDLLRQMGRLVVPLLPAEREARRHERMVASVNRLLMGLPVRPSRRVRLGRAFGATAAVAACFALLLGALRAGDSQALVAKAAHVISVSGESTRWRSGNAPSLLVAEQQVEPGDEVRTATSARTELALAGAGTARVDVSENTRVLLNQRVVGQAAASEDWLELEEGLVTLQVAKLRPGLVLAVQTPDARVTVHGTRFSVRVVRRTPASSLTEVAVTEGLVQVDSRGQEVFLGPGQYWSSEAAPATQDALPSARPELPAGAASAARGAPSRPRGNPASTHSKESTLGEENRLYAQALAHARAGDLPQALNGLAELLRDYPSSPLAQSAQVDRFRFLEQSGDRSAAAQEARRYLSAYPNGFARAEARKAALVEPEAPE